jgi:bis(5'-nucleosyl)-tetraphosphatase (symmetrical)
MATYWVGDLQGCNTTFGQLLSHIDFSPSRDHLVVLGDLINRGPDSAGVLQRLMSFTHSATCLLGNHDLFILAAYHGAKPLKRGDTAGLMFDHAMAPAWMDWLAWRPLAWQASGCLLVHAGVLPSWSQGQTMALASEVQDILRSRDRQDFLHQMFGNLPNRWSDDLRGIERWRVIVNALTRLRFCTPEGDMEFATKEGLGAAPPGHQPWFEAPHRRTQGVPVVFGHWSTVGGLCRPNVACIDTGCLWGRSLSALRVPEAAALQSPPDLTQWEWISVTADPGDVVAVL